MELILKRTEKRKTYTIGHLYALTENTEMHVADTLEPTWRDYGHGQRKIAGRSAIPEGRYAVVISWDKRREEWLPVLLGGPEFNRRWGDIRIHDGYCQCDTRGSILVGEKGGDGQLLNSRIWLHRLKQMIVEAKEQGEPVWLEVK